MRSSGLFVFASLMMLCLPGDAAGQAGPLTIEDYVALKTFSSPRLSPDGERIAYVISSTDWDRSLYNADVWVVDRHGRNRIRLAGGPHNENNPRWSPDGRLLAFLSNREGSTQVWLIPTSAGEAWRLTDAKGTLTDFEWSPDGSSIAFLMREPESDRDRERRNTRNDARVLDEGIRHSHLHAIDIRTREMRQVTSGGFSIMDFAWSPDGSAFAVTRCPTPRVPDNYNSDIYTVSAAGGELRPIVVRPGIDRNPQYSPDGKWIAFLSGRGRVDWAADTHLAVVGADGGEARVVSGDYNRSPGAFAWQPDSSGLVFNGPWNTTAQIFRVGIEGKDFEDLTRVQGVIQNAHFDLRHDRAVFVYQNLTSAPELFVSSLGLFRPLQISEENASLKKKRLGETRLIRWKNPKDGLQIEGLLTLPLGYQADRRYPLLTFVHGGPASFFDQQYMGYLAYIYPAHVFAARGFAVLRPNPRGSGAYGESFRQANRADWGGMDYLDIKSGIDELVRQGIADPDKLGLMGWSYGGFMTSWAITQTSRFKAASIGAPVTDLFTFQGTSDIPGFIPSYFAALPYKAQDLYHAHNPMSHVQKARTPALIQHGEADDRVPLSQGLIYYQALKDLGVPAMMVVYPRTPHTPQEPRLRVDVARGNIWWFEKWINGEEKSFEDFWR